MIDFSTVFLSRDDLNLLHAAEYGKVLDATHISLRTLTEYGFVEPYRSSDREFVITPLGLHYCEYIDRKVAESRKRERKESFRFWLPVVLSNIMALAALIISIIALQKTQ